MRLKTLILSVLVLAALAAAVYFLRRPDAAPAADARLGQPLLDRAIAEKATRLSLSDGGKTVLATRQADGTWTVPSYFDLPAEFSKLTSFVGTLTDAKIQRLVTTNPARIARLGFKDTTVALQDSAGHELWSIMLGKTPEEGGGRFVQFGHEPKAYLTDFSGWLDADSKNWADPALLSLKPETIAQVEILSADGGDLVFSRAKKDAPWTADKTPAGQRVKADRIASLLGSIGTLRFSETSDPTDANVVAARANLRTYKLTTFDHKTITVALGRKPEVKKLKAPAPATEPAKNAEAAKEPGSKPAELPKPADAKPPAPEYDITPAGPVYVFINESGASSPINAAMAKRAFEIPEFTFTGLPQKNDEFFEAVPEAKSDDKKPADAKPKG
jgi:hypothetical protein